MLTSRFLGSAALTGAVVALVSFSACNTTEVVTVPYDGGGSDAPAIEPDASEDAPVADAKADVDDGKCHPGPVTGFTDEPYQPPTGGFQGLCTDLQIKAYIDCANGNTTACSDLMADGGASCTACIQTSKSATKWGPLVVGAGILGTELNEAGCGALENNDTGKTGCGQALANYAGCVHYTCRTQCPDALYYDCAVESQKGICKSFAAAPKSTCTSSVSSCFALSGDGKDDLAIRIIKRFCGSP